MFGFIGTFFQMIFSFLYQYFQSILFSPRQIIVLVVGEEGSGKTTLSYGILRKNNEKVPKTIGVKIVKYGGRNSYSEVTLWDSSGVQGVVDSMWEQYISIAHKVIFVCSHYKARKRKHYSKFNLLKKVVKLCKDEKKGLMIVKNIRGDTDKFFSEKQERQIEIMKKKKYIVDVIESNLIRDCDFEIFDDWIEIVKDTFE